MSLAHRAFDGNLSPARVMTELAFLLDANISREHDLLIFDEIQAFPRALTSLKYFHEQQPEMAVAAAGSLLGLSLSDTPFPVGKVDRAAMYPLSFLEFLWALGDERGATFVAQCHQRTTIAEVIHQHLWERLRWYLVTGGLPEVVLTFLEHRDDLSRAFARVRERQHELLLAYSADFAKHAGKVSALHIECTWRAVPQQLAAAQDASASRFHLPRWPLGARHAAPASGHDGSAEAEPHWRRVQDHAMRHMERCGFTVECSHCVTWRMGHLRRIATRFWA